MNDSNTKYLKDLGCVVLAAFILTLCLIPGFLRLPYGVNSFDEPYQMLNGMFPQNAPYSPLSAYFTKWFGELFDWRWLYFRYLTLGLNAISILIAGGYLYVKSQQYGFSLAVTSLAILGGTIIPNTVNIYGWDDWTQLFTVILIIAVLNFFSNPTYFKIIVIGFIATAISLIRIPNVVVFPVMLLILWYLVPFNHKERRINYIVIFIVSFVISLTVALCLMFGSIGNYFEELFSSPITKHGIKEVGYNCMLTVCEIIGCIFIIRGFYRTAQTKLIKSLKWKYTLIGFASFCFFFLYTNFAENEFYIWSLSALASIVIYGIILIFYSNRFNLKINLIYQLIAASLLACVPFVGSNLGVVKFLIFPMFCIIGLYIRPYLNKSLKAIFIGMVIGIVCFVCFRMHRIGFFDKGYSFTTYEFTTGKMQGLYTTPERGQKIQKLIDEVEKFDSESNKIINIRLNENYLAEYLFNTRNSHLGSRFDYPDIHFNQEYVRWTENEIVSSEKPVVIIYQKHDRFETSDIPYLPMLQMIQKHLVLAGDIDGFLIYASTDAIKSN